LRRAAAKQVHLERFEVEDSKQILNGGGHGERVKRAVHMTGGRGR